MGAQSILYGHVQLYSVQAFVVILPPEFDFTRQFSNHECRLHPMYMYNLESKFQGTQSKLPSKFKHVIITHNLLSTFLCEDTTQSAAVYLISESDHFLHECCLPAHIMSVV